MENIGLIMLMQLEIEIVRTVKKFAKKVFIHDFNLTLILTKIFYWVIEMTARLTTALTVQKMRESDWTRDKIRIDLMFGYQVTQLP